MAAQSVFKIFFEGCTTLSASGLNLTFKQISKPVVIADFTSFLVKVNENARKKKCFSFGNIKQVIPPPDLSNNKFKQYIVILYSQKLDHDFSRKGLLITDHAELGYILTALWPINNSDENSMNQEKIMNIFGDIIQNSDSFSDILVIT